MIWTEVRRVGAIGGARTSSSCLAGSQKALESNLENEAVKLRADGHEVHMIEHTWVLNGIG